MRSGRGASASRWQNYEDLEGELDKWYTGLPPELRYDVNRRTVPPPHVLFLHIQYWSTVLLLNRGLWVSRLGDRNVYSLSTAFQIGRGQVQSPLAAVGASQKRRS